MRTMLAPHSPQNTMPLKSCTALSPGLRRVSNESAFCTLSKSRRSMMASWASETIAHSLSGFVTRFRTL